MEEQLNKCLQITRDPYTYLKSWKKQNNKKIICCYPMHVPEEVVHAAGMLPVVAWRSNEPVTLGHSHVASFNCGLTRSFIDDLAKEKLDFLDGVIIYRMCLQAQGLPFIIERNFKLPYLEYLSLPALYPGAALRDYLSHEMGRYRASVEEFAGRKITDEDLSRSIEVYNKNRRLLSKVYEIRRQNPGAIKAGEMMAIVQAAMLMPKEENNRLLEQLIPQLEKRQAGARKKIRVVIYGGLCQTPHLEILDAIEELGMEVVDDDLYVGARYFANEAAVVEKPLDALAGRYLQRTPPCPTKGDYQFDWTDYLIEKAQQNGAQGIISLLIKYCPPHLCYYPDIKNKLAEKGIPEVLIEAEHEIVSLEQVKTRLQSFVEVVGGV
jgi:benzoyl-CoA reductase subunit C